MELLAVPMLASALIGAAAGRWTTLHPLATALLLWMVGAAMVTLVLAGFGSPGALVAGLVFGSVFGGTAAFGAFMGRLRRQHVKRMS